MEADIEDFKAGYQRLCKEQRIDIQDCILQQIDVARKSPRQGGGFVLNLTTYSLTAKTCGVLAKLLTSDRAFVELKFNDCSLSEEAVKALCYGLSENSCCKRLDLKGNSIRGPAVETIARVIRQNTTLVCLCLEWNEVGLVESSFTALCDGLSNNASLLSLDLRSNRISHHGAQELARALKKNSTLRILDLRFNSVGLLGGRALLSCLETNKTLVKVTLAGNNIPGDIIKAIEVAISHNADRSSLKADHATRQRMLSSEIQQLNKTRRNEVIQLLDKVDRQEAAIYQTKLCAAEKINKLQSSMEERKQQFNNVVSKLSLVESELSVSESRVNELNQQLLRVKEEHSACKNQFDQDTKRFKEEKALLEKRLNKELQDLSDKKYQLETKVEDLERLSRQYQEQIFSLRESVAHLQAELKMKHAQHEESQQFEKQKCKDLCRDIENMKDKEIERLRKDMDGVERGLKDRIQRLESQRIELEEELSRQKLNMASERIQYEEQIAAAKQHIRNEEEQRRSGIEEKLRVLQASKDEIQTHLTVQTNLVSELQGKNSQLAIDNDNLRKRIADLQQEVAGKNEEMREEVNRVRQDLLSRIDRLESDRRPKEELYNRITVLEKELAETKAKHREETKNQEHEYERLMDRLKIKELEISRMREADLQRNTLLTNAVQNYINKSPYISE